MIDDLERNIIRVLNQNARKSFREIAKDLGTSVTAVINRIKKFEEKGVIKGYIPIVDPEYFGLDLIAVIALSITKGNTMKTQEKIAEDSHVVAVYDITGEWDSLLIGYFRNRQDLNDYIKNLLSQEGIFKSVTHIVLNVVKDEKRVII